MAIIAVSTPSLRTLKNSLKDRLPSFVKSSHVSEAVAYALGFKTNIALTTRLAKLADGWANTLAAERFFERLAQLGYEGVPRFSIDSVAPTFGVPSHIARLLSQIWTLQQHDNPAQLPRVYSLQNQCKVAFGQFWNLGYPDPVEDDTGWVLRNERGVDYSACRPGWGNRVRSMGPGMTFPGTDHAVRFYERLPLSNGEYVEYSTALVSMPYVAATNNLDKLPAAQVLADTIGWETHVLPSWTWYTPSNGTRRDDATTLILFRRKETPEETRRAWTKSLKRWVIENREQLAQDADGPREAAIGEVMESAHFPLAVESFDELQKLYLDEFMQTGFMWKPGVIERGMQELFALWKAARVGR